MGFLGWLFQKPQFKRFDDAYALTRESLWNSLEKTIRSDQHTFKSIWLITHFTDTFTALQDKLDEWSQEYEIVSSLIDPNALDRSNLLSPHAFKVVLAEMIPAATPTLQEVNREQTVAMIVVERHPHLKHDERIIEFAKSLPCLVEFGYYLSLEDTVVKMVVNETAVTILKQLGLNEHALITSNMVSRRLDKSLQQRVDSYAGDAPADSAKQWLELNG